MSSSHNCPFCKSILRKSEGFNRYWLLCDYCNVTYQQDDTGNVEIIRFKTILNEEKYTLDLLLKNSISEILHIPFNIKKLPTVILRLPFLVKGITPSNCQDKIKTYIMFS